MTVQFTEQQLKDRLKAKLESGEITRDQAAMAVAEFKSRTQQAAPQSAAATEPSMLDRLAQTSSDISGQINRSLQGVGESALAMGSAAIAEPVAGWAGILSMLPGGRTPAEAVAETREALTYQPRTEAGQQAMTEAGQVLAPVGQALEAVETGFGEVGYQGAGMIPGVSEEVQAGAGAIMSAVPAAVAEILGFKGTRAAKKAALAEQVRQSGVDQVLTPEAVVALRKSGFTDADLQDVVAADPRQVERLERFQRQGIQATRGDITMDTAQRRAEQQLAETAQGEAAEQMRQLRVQQSQALQTNFEDMVDAYGFPDELGQSIKDAVNSRKQIALKDSEKAYDALATAQGGADNVPILMPAFENMPNLPKDKQMRRIKGADPQNYALLQDALAEVGLSTDEKALSRLADEGVEPTALNIQNFEEFRKDLNVIRKNDEKGIMSPIIEPIISELDRQIDIATDTLMTSGNPDIAEIAKEARNSWKGYKTEFDTKALTTKVIETKPRSSLPVTEVSQVYDAVTARSVPVEQVGRLLDSLEAQGGKGNRAIGNLQASVVMDVLDSGFKGSTNKIGDAPVFSGAAMSKRFFDPKFNQKIQEVFRNNPEGYRQLEDLIRTAQDLTPGKLETVKGSGSVILDIANAVGLAKIGTIPGVNVMVEQMRDLSARSKNRQVLNRALKAQPDLKMAANDLVQSFPMLGAALGIGYISGLEEEE